MTAQLREILLHKDEEFVVRYVIGKDSIDNKYIVEEFKNKKNNDAFLKITNNK